MKLSLQQVVSMYEVNIDGIIYIIQVIYYKHTNNYSVYMYDNAGKKYDIPKEIQNELKKLHNDIIFN